MGPVHRDVIVEHSGREIRCDIVEPVGTGPHPVLIYLHGGGWVAGDLNVYHQLVLRFAEQGFVVLAVDYSLAPEHPFPAGYDDCAAAVHWAVANISRYGGNPGKIAVAGDSAGANLAAALGVAEPKLPIGAVALIYGTFDFERMGPDPDFRELLLHAYVGGSENMHLGRDPRVSPIHRASRMPPAFIVAGSEDAASVIEQSAELAAEMKSAGTEHRNQVIKGYPHGFMQDESLPETLPLYHNIAAFLRDQMTG